MDIAEDVNVAHRKFFDAVLAAYDAETKCLPLGHEMPTRGASTYNWRRSVVDELRAIASTIRSGAATE